MSDSISLVWFRNDLRLTDNHALLAACRRGRHVVPVYIWNPTEEGGWPPGAASRWWLHQSLKALNTDLADLNSRLVIRKGDALTNLKALLSETGATEVYWNRRYEPF
ncbi:MAG TPA: deoxyribodipyrimidine photo-lyase, partial [Chroococcales cyanobacterium]